MDRKIIRKICFAAALLMTCACTGSDEKSVYPIDTDTTLTYWVPLNSVVAAFSANLGDTEFAKALEKQTGIKVNYIHSEADNTVEAFQMMIASRNLPDIIENNWDYYPGGSAAAVADGSIISIDRMMEEYSPNLARVLRENNEIAEKLKNSNGGINYYPFLRLDEKLLVNRGFILRKDWLDELGMSVPETIDEWTEVLTAFRDVMGAEAPISSGGDSKGFIAAYGIDIDYYIEDGVVKSGLLQPGYKNFLMKMHEWYQAGLIAKNFINMDSQAVEQNMLKGKSGACFTYAGSGMGSLLDSENKPEGFDLVGAPFPVINKGDLPTLLYKDKKISGIGAAITTMCKDVRLAARLLDYGYSSDGHMLYNFGVEGISYTMVDGEAVYTDIVKNAPDGMYFGSALAKYARGSYSGPFVQDVKYIEQYYTYPQQQEAVAAWSIGQDDNILIPEIDLTEEESREIVVLNVRISDYANEMYKKMIFGVVSFDEYDSYIDNLRKMGIDRILEIYNNALHSAE